MILHVDSYGLLAEHKELLIQKLQAWPVGKRLGLVELFGDAWDEIGIAGQKRAFGMQFKRAVKDMKLGHIEWCGIENSGRYDTCRKLK